MGRNFFSMPRDTRSNIRILELGCGTGGNLRLVADEGFEAWGYDLETAYLDEAERFLRSRGLSARLDKANIADRLGPDRHFDAIFEVFSAYCLDDAKHDRMLGNVAKALKPGGLFFSYTPSRTTAHLRPIFFSNEKFEWRFTTLEEHVHHLVGHGFKIRSHGILRRSEGLEFVVVEAGI